MMIRIDIKDLEQIIRDAIRDSWAIDVSIYEATAKAMIRIKERGDDDT